MGGIPRARMRRKPSPSSPPYPDVPRNLQTAGPRSWRNSCIQTRGGEHLFHVIAEFSLPE